MDTPCSFPPVSISSVSLFMLTIISSCFFFGVNYMTCGTSRSVLIKVVQPGGRVSCVAVDSKSGAVAVTDGGCHVLLYTQDKVQAADDGADGRIPV